MTLLPRTPAISSACTCLIRRSVIGKSAVKDGQVGRSQIALDLRDVVSDRSAVTGLGFEPSDNEAFGASIRVLANASFQTNDPSSISGSRISLPSPFKSPSWHRPRTVPRR